MLANIKVPSFYCSVDTHRGNSVKNRKMNKNKMDQNTFKFWCMSNRTINVNLCRPVPSSSVINDRLPGELELRALFALYKSNSMTTGLDWCWQIALRLLVLSLSFFFYMSRLARLLVKSTQTLFNQISQKASLLSLFCIYDEWMIIIKWTYPFTNSRRSQN
jgi:hypothetical protein